MTATKATTKKGREPQSDWGDEVTRLLDESNDRVYWQSTLRESVSSFLPPPITRSIHLLDPMLEPYVGPEATTTIVVTALLGWILIFLVSLCRRTGKAVVDEEERLLESKLAQDATTTVLLVGSRKAGKTRLFCQLAYGISHQETVMSLKPNVATVNDIKYIDWPGHCLDFSTDIRHRRNLRVILMVDATQPARIAADKLFVLLNDVLWHQHKKYKTKTLVFVACHKKDLPKAKNEKRIKIQLRTELERLVQARSGDNKVEWWPTDDRLELDQIGICSFYFGPTTCESSGAPELSKFCKSGVFPKDSS
jgi:signal recognition particle receptor subunit beta